jgi:hypothetical protein
MLNGCSVIIFSKTNSTISKFKKKNNATILEQSEDWAYIKAHSCVPCNMKTQALFSYNSCHYHCNNEA